MHRGEHPKSKSVSCQLFRMPEDKNWVVQKKENMKAEGIPTTLFARARTGKNGGEAWKVRRAKNV